MNSWSKIFISKFFDNVGGVYHKFISRSNSTLRVSFDLVIRACQLDVIWHFGSSYCYNNIYLFDWRCLNVKLNQVFQRKYNVVLWLQTRRQKQTLARARNYSPLKKRKHEIIVSCTGDCYSKIKVNIIPWAKKYF